MKIVPYLVAGAFIITGCNFIISRYDNDRNPSLKNQTQLGASSTNLLQPVVVILDNFAQSTASYDPWDQAGPALLFGNIRVETIYTSIQIDRNRSYVITYAALLKESTLLMKQAVETGCAQAARDWAETIHFLQVSRDLEEAKELKRAVHAQLEVTK